MRTMESLTTPNVCNWCSGCGNFGIWTAFKRAAVAQDWNDSNTVLVAGIGCHGHIVNFVKMTAFEGLHGRAIPVASGVKLANKDLNVFVFSGDGDGLSEGGNHFIHAARRNQDLTYILHDNGVFSLTTGQTSPRSPHGYKSKSTPGGNLEYPINPLEMALTAGATFLARCYSGDVDHVAEMITKANEHKGFAVVDILQPCITFNKELTHAFYQKNIYHLDPSYDPANKEAAREKCVEWGENKIPVGIIYQNNQPSYEDLVPLFKKESLVSRDVKIRDVGPLLQRFK